MDGIAKHDHPSAFYFFHALIDEDLFGPHFTDASWDSWRAIWKAIDGLPLTEHEQALFQKLAGGVDPADVFGTTQLFVAKGRGAGGSRMLAVRGLYGCIGYDWSPKLAVGETATALILATDQRQAKETFGYVEGLTDDCPVLSEMVIRRTKSLIEFNNRTQIEVRTASFRKVRGFTLCYVGLDELSFWADKSTGANPAKFVYDALLPALGRLPGSFLFGCSTPWSASGFFAEKIQRHFGKKTA